MVNLELLIHVTIIKLHVNAPFYGGGHLYFDVGIIIVKGISKYTLSMNFRSMKLDFTYAFLHGFFP